jgi:deazaflavin-dependent oxidoreductase (nitroreductase family)
MSRAPALVRFSNPITSRLLRLGLPLGPNVVLTVRGRRSGVARSVPIAIAEIDGHRYIIGAYGEVAWVHNLRAAGEATVQLDGRDVAVEAAELDPERSVELFRSLPAFVARLPWFGQLFIRALFAIAAPEVLRDPVAASRKHPVFELILSGRGAGATAPRADRAGTAAARSA